MVPNYNDYKEVMQYSCNIRINVFIAQHFIADKSQNCSFLCWVQCIKWCQQQPSRHLNIIKNVQIHITLLLRQFTSN